MDIKAKITELVDKIKNDPKLAEKFQKEPVATIEGLLGVDLPDNEVEKVVEGVKAKISIDKLGGTLGSLLGKK